MSVILDIQDLRVSFPQGKGQSKEVVHGIDVVVHAGEIVAIVGESGSGKSVSMMAISGLIPKAEISAKKCLFRSGDQSYDLLDAEEEELRKIRAHEISYVFQEPMTALNPLMTCGKQVEEAMPGESDKMKKALSLFEEVKLPDVERMYSAYPHQLSGGQRQRVMIAMALANEPQLLIADEPTTALDAIIQDNIVQLLADACRKRSMGLVFISHDLNVVKKIADKVLVLLHGEVVESGSSDDIFQKSTNPYTLGLLSSKPSFEKKGSTLSVYNTSEMETEESVVLDKADHSGNTLMSFEETGKSYIKKIGLLGRKSQITKAVDAVSMDIKQGEALGLVGESGCGKSTLAKITARLIDATSGEVKWQEHNIYNMGKSFARKVQMVFQDPYSSLNPVISVGNAIMEPIRVHKLAKSKEEAKAQTIKLLEDVGLTAEDFNKYPHEFSGGQRQRVCIARALAVQPELIICDESVSALDVSVQAKILNLLQILQGKYGLTYLFISHDLNVVSYFCDRIVVMKEGKLEEIASTDQLLKQPKSAYSKHLMDFR